MLRVLMSLALAVLLLGPSPAPADAQGAPTITVDRGPGATYAVGEPLVVRYSVPRPTFVRILSTAVNGTTVLVEGNVSGAGELPITVGLPIGQRTLTLQTYSGNQLGATATTGYTVVASAGAAPRALACGAQGGQLASAVDVETWTFAGTVGQELALRLEAPLQLPIRLVAPSGALLGTGFNSLSATLATTGQYRVEVGGGATSANQSGPVAYTLTFDCVAPGSAVGGEGQLASPVALECGGAITGQLADITDIQNWLVRAPAGLQITISTRATVPVPLRVYDANGVLLTAASNEVRNFVFPVEGVYQVAVGNGTIANAPAPLDYSLTVTCAPPPVVIVPNNLPCNSVVNAVLTNVTDVDRYVFAGITGHTANVQVNSPTPLPVQVVDVNNAVIGQGVGSVRVPITGPTGSMTLLIGGVETPTPGGSVPYTLSLQCNN